MRKRVIFMGRTLKKYHDFICFTVKFSLSVLFIILYLMSKKRDSIHYVKKEFFRISRFQRRIPPSAMLQKFFTSF